MEIPEGEGIFETIMTENFPRLMLGTKSQIQEAQKTPSRTNAKQKTTHTYTIFKLYKDKRKSWKKLKGGGNSQSNKDKKYI